VVEFLKNVRQGPDAPPGAASRGVLRQLAVKFRTIGAERGRGLVGVGMESDVGEKIFPEGVNESYDEPSALSSGGAICLRAAWRFLHPRESSTCERLFFSSRRENILTRDNARRRRRRRRSTLALSIKLPEIKPAR